MKTLSLSKIVCYKLKVKFYYIKTALFLLILTTYIEACINNFLITNIQFKLKKYLNFLVALSTTFFKTMDDCGKNFNCDTV